MRQTSLTAILEGWSCLPSLSCFHWLSLALHSGNGRAIGCKLSSME